jgi:hypothetical protein
MNESDFETVASFDNAFDPQLLIVKSMLDEAGIRYYTVNEEFRALKPLPMMAPHALTIRLCVETARRDEALGMLRAIDARPDGED